MAGPRVAVAIALVVDLDLAVWLCRLAGDAKERRSRHGRPTGAVRSPVDAFAHAEHSASHAVLQQYPLAQIPFRHSLPLARGPPRT